MDREMSLTVSMLEGVTEILEDRIKERSKVGNPEFQRMVECGKRLAQAIQDAKDKT